MLVSHSEIWNYWLCLSNLAVFGKGFIFFYVIIWLPSLFFEWLCFFPVCYCFWGSFWNCLEYGWKRCLVCNHRRSGFNFSFFRALGVCELVIQSPPFFIETHFSIPNLFYLLLVAVLGYVCTLRVPIRFRGWVLSNTFPTPLRWSHWCMRASVCSVDVIYLICWFVQVYHWCLPLEINPTWPQRSRGIIFLLSKLIFWCFIDYFCMCLSDISLQFLSVMGWVW